MLDIALIQFKPVLGDIPENTALVKGLLQQTSSAALVVLPELASTGYNFRDAVQARNLAEDPGQSKYVDTLADVASKNGQFIVTGFSEKAPEGIYNSALLIGPGGVVGKYRKMHLFMHEKDFFLPGDGDLRVFDIGHARLGIQICFDYLFPEPWRILAQQEADIIVHPSNLLTQNATKALPGIALMNRVFIATANRIGTEGTLTFNGGSMIIGPSGNILSKAGEKTTDIVQQSIDPALSQNKMVTEINHVFDDRRPEQYKRYSC